MQLIVLGMHRSGTSSVTRLLNLAGAYFGAEGVATEANDENPKGFWERRDVRNVCDALLLGGGFDWWRVAGFEADRIPDDIREEQLDAFRRIVLQLDAHRPWVVKEPRLCLLLPVLRPLLEAPVLVHVTREPLEVASSLEVRNEFPVPAGLALWEAYTVAALQASVGEQAVEVAYADLMSDPVGTTATLVERLTALGVPGLRTPSEREITAFVSPSLHRQHRAAKDRSGYLNAGQAALAEAADEGRLLELEAPTLTAGAQATLHAFEDRQALASTLAEARVDQDRQAAAHRAELERLAAEQRAREQAQQRREAKEREVTAAQERRAIDALDVAAQQIRAVKGSGAVRLGARLSTVRERVRGGSTIGVHGAIKKALDQVDTARSVLEDHLGAGPSITVGDGGEPPPLAQQRARRREARQRGDRPKVAVVAWDIGHNPFGRAHLLADLLRDRFDVELWGSQFDRYGTDVWSPMRGTTIPVRRFSGSSFPQFLETLDDAVRWMEVDAIWVSKPRFPSLALGALAKERWNRPLVVDVDDFEPSFFDESDGLPIEELLRRRDDPDLELPFGRLWTQACASVVTAADQVTVSNLQLQARYGGIVVPHARDEAVFDPARFDRSEARQRLGLREDDRLVLFGGTPRAHKGVLDLLHALEALGDDHLRLGVFDGKELAGLRTQIGELERWIHPLPHYGFDELPGLLAAADLTCALQAPDHPVSRYQMPAKVTDAMAMGIPCLVTPVPPLQPLIDKDVVEVFDGDASLPDRIREILDDTEATADRAARAREVFLESYSYAAVRPVAAAAIERHLDDPPAPTAPMRALVGTARYLFQPGAPPPPARRPRVPKGATYDLVIFWKQNDTGIYGRRQDMFLKYLERSGRFGTIVHFDQPMSAESLAALGRRSVGSPDQHRFVVAQTVRRLLHRSDRGAVRHRTFLYANSRAGRTLGLPRRDGYLAFVRSVLAREGIGQRPLLCWVYPTNPHLPALLDELRPAVVVADVVDDNRTWYSPGSVAYGDLEQNYADVLARADVVLANCNPVADSMRLFAPQVDVLPNACELPVSVGPEAPPPELVGLARPIIGYAGNLSDRIDIPLLRQLAQARPQWTLVLLGSAHKDPAALALADEPNVRFLGTKQYDDAQAIIRHFDVGLIPHVDNEMTRSMNPLKAFVYCSLGVPVVSTPVANLGELAAYITIADGLDEFVDAIEDALERGRQVPDREALLPHSWEERVTRVLARVDDVADRRANEPA